MRFFEIAAPRAKIMATKRFMKNAAVYLRGGFPGLEKNLKEFLEFKSENPLAPFSKKDSPFSNNNHVLRAQHLWHCHLVHGKVIAIYAATSTEIRLIDMVDHTAVDGAHATQLGPYAASLGPEDFTPVVIQGTKPDAISPSQKKELDDLLWEMSVQDRDILTSALKGDFADLIEFMKLVVDASPDDLIAAYGGETGIQNFINQMLRQMGVA